MHVLCGGGNSKVCGGEEGGGVGWNYAPQSFHGFEQSGAPCSTPAPKAKEGSSDTTCTSYVVVVVVMVRCVWGKGGG